MLHPSNAHLEAIRRVNERRRFQSGRYQKKEGGESLGFFLPLHGLFLAKDGKSMGTGKT